MRNCGCLSFWKFVALSPYDKSYSRRISKSIISFQETSWPYTSPPCTSTSALSNPLTTPHSRSRRRVACRKWVVNVDLNTRISRLCITISIHSQQPILTQAKENLLYAPGNATNGPGLPFPPFSTYTHPLAQSQAPSQNPKNIP